MRILLLFVAVFAIYLGLSGKAGPFVAALLGSPAWSGGPGGGAGGGGGGGSNFG